MFNKYPYTDFHELNTDWLINEVKSNSQKLDKFINEGIREELDKLFIDATYDEPTETLTLILGVNE